MLIRRDGEMPNVLLKCVDHAFHVTHGNDNIIDKLNLPADHRGIAAASR